MVEMECSCCWKISSYRNFDSGLMKLLVLKSWNKGSYKCITCISSLPFFSSNYTGFRFDKSITVLRRLGLKTPVMANVRYISNNIRTFSGTGRAIRGTQSWNAQRDQTPLLSVFKNLAFQESRKVFLKF